MINAAVICEYNPFHNGHKYQLEKARQEIPIDNIICYLSGNFVQRGEFALYNKHARAKAAIASGADLIFENPAHYVLQSAEGYASAAVFAISKLNCVDYLIFGAECDDLDALKSIAKMLSQEGSDYKLTLSDNLKKGMSYPAARSESVAAFLGSDAKDILSKPNNLLAIEYLKAIYKYNSPIKPLLIKREGTDHDSETINNGFASATMIRKLVQNNGPESISSYVPKEAYSVYKDLSFVDNNTISKAIHASLCLSSKERIKACGDISEGLENKIKSSAMRFHTLDECIKDAKSKRYPLSRIRRSVLCSYLGTDKTFTNMQPPYVKILDFNQKGKEVLNLCKKTSEITVAKNASAIKKDDISLKLWAKELEFDKVYEIMSQTDITRDKYL